MLGCWCSGRGERALVALAAHAAQRALAMAQPPREVALVHVAALVPARAAARHLAPVPAAVVVGVGLPHSTVRWSGFGFGWELGLGLGWGLGLGLGLGLGFGLVGVGLLQSTVKGPGSGSGGSWG